MPLTFQRSEFQEFMERLVAVELARHALELELIESRKQNESKSTEIDILKKQVEKLNDALKGVVSSETGIGNTVPSQPVLRRVGSTEVLETYETETELEKLEKQVKRLTKKLERSEKRCDKLTSELAEFKKESELPSKSTNKTIRKLESEIVEHEELINHLKQKNKQLEKEKTIIEQRESQLKQQLAEKSHKRGCTRF